MEKLFSQLAKDFRDKEYAHGYMESHAISRLAAQVHALRRQRGWSQETLAQLSGIAQERISKIESADFESLTMKTLQKLSRAFDVNLFIAFEPFSKGIVDVANLGREQLEMESRSQDLTVNFVSIGEWKTTGRTTSIAPFPAMQPAVIKEGAWLGIPREIAFG